jgi:putative glutamine amidotransferase
MTIAISKASGSPNYHNYIRWTSAAAEQSGAEVTCVDLSDARAFATVEAAVQALEHCAGLMLTGGPDVFPARYGKGSELARCSVDEARDVLEFALYEKARDLKMPTLGICRGAQLLNVAHGGTLVIDIPADTQATTEHARIMDVDSVHPFHAEAGSVLVKITGEIEGTVNSAHHQAVERLGEGLRVSGYSADGIVEGIEWQDSTGRPFLLGVQWHPERMDYDNPFSLSIAQHFLFEAESYQLLAHRMKAVPQPL